MPTAIEKLRLKFKPSPVILVGHSGGAATAAVLEVRTQLSGLTRYLINKSHRLHGHKGRQHIAKLGESYIDLLRSRGIDASFHVIGEATHNSAARSAEVLDAIAKLLHR